MIKQISYNTYIFSNHLFVGLKMHRYFEVKLNFDHLWGCKSVWLKNSNESNERIQKGIRKTSSHCLRKIFCLTEISVRFENGGSCGQVITYRRGRGGRGGEIGDEIHQIPS